MACKSRLDLRIWRLARAQHGVGSGAQLAELGLTRSAIGHRIRTGRLWRVHVGVFAVGRPELTPEGRWSAAVLACGPGAALSHSSAAALWEILDVRRGARPEVSVPTQAGRRGSRAVILHRALSLRPADVTIRRGIPVTSLERTLLDLARVPGDRRLKRALREAERVHRLDLERFASSLVDVVRSTAHTRLRRLLERYLPAASSTESELEALFVELCAEHGLPLPRTQVPVGPHRIDFLWPDSGLAVETDGFGYHRGTVAFSEDRARDRALKAAGLEVLRFTWADVTGEPARTAAEIHDALARCVTERGRLPQDTG